jgi:hypothetical protein
MEESRAMRSLTGFWWVRKRAPKEDISSIWEFGGDNSVKDHSSGSFGAVDYQESRIVIRWKNSRSYEILDRDIRDVMVADSWNSRKCTVMKWIGGKSEQFLWRDRLETDVSDRCNYSCNNCNHLSPYYKDNRYSFDEWNKDIETAARFIRVEIFNLLGGEPFLLNNLEEYVRVLKASPICNRIGIWTNGALLPRLKDFSVLTDVDEIVVSYYPSVQAPSLDAWLAAYHDKFPCRFILNRIDSFFVFFDPNKHDKQQTASAWTSCTDKRDCHTIYKGRYYLCPSSNKFKYLLKEKYHVAEDLEDGALLEGSDANSLQNYIAVHRNQVPLKTCSYCNFRTGATEPHKQAIYEKIL